jgi:hypothetical protein
LLGTLETILLIGDFVLIVVRLRGKVEKSKRERETKMLANKHTHTVRDNKETNRDIHIERGERRERKKERDERERERQSVLEGVCARSAKEVQQNVRMSHSTTERAVRTMPKMSL